VLRKCADLPPYQEQFTGYGKNKIQHILHLRHLLFRFAVGGGIFITHFPHVASAARRDWNQFDKKEKAKMEAAKKGGDGDVDALADFHRVKMDTLFAEFKGWVMEVVGDQYQKITSYTPLCVGMSDDDRFSLLP
jgi:hypothetical protein